MKHLSKVIKLLLLTKFLRTIKKIFLIVLLFLVILIGYCVWTPVGLPADPFIINEFHDLKVTGDKCYARSVNNNDPKTIANYNEVADSTNTLIESLILAIRSRESRDDTMATVRTSIEKINSKISDLDCKSANNLLDVKIRLNFESLRQLIKETHSSTSKQIKTLVKELEEEKWLMIKTDN